MASSGSMVMYPVAVSVSASRPKVIHRCIISHTCELNCSRVGFPVKSNSSMLWLYENMALRRHTCARLHHRGRSNDSDGSARFKALCAHQPAAPAAASSSRRSHGSMAVNPDGSA